MAIIHGFLIFICNSADKRKERLFAAWHNNDCGKLTIVGQVGRDGGIEAGMTPSIVIDE